MSIAKMWITKTMKFWRNKKIIIILVVAIFFSISGFKVVVAAESAIEGTTSVVVYTAAMGITFLAGKIVSALYTAIAGLIDIAIRANALILSSPIVLSGWQIVLSFANLGFVLAIIIIAFATIFRLQSYAMKQVLWKLIVAALLVNFSLVIAGAFINVADNVTSSFNNKIKGADVSTALTGLLEVQTFTSPVWEKMTGAERYSRGVLKATDALLNLVTLNWYTYLTGGLEGNLWGDQQSALSLVTGEKDLKSESLLLIIGSIFFSILFTFLSALTLLAVAVMMFIRYFFLGVLLILSPIVWLLWIFPGTSNLWQKWWSEFLRWTFFAPIMMFFLYLAIATISVENLKDAKLQGAIQGSQQFTENLAKKQEGGLVVDIAKFGNLALVIGLIMSGLIAANSLGITGASTAMGFAKGAGKWAQGAVGRKGLQYGTAGFRAKLWKDEEGKRTKSFGEKAVEWSSKTGWLGRHTLGYAARGITRLETAGGENILKEHAKAAGNMSDADIKASALTASGPRKIAVAKELQKRKLLGDVDAKNFITEGNQSLFGRFRQGVSWGDIEHGAKMDTKIAKEIRETGRASLESVNAFIKTYKGKDIEPSAIKDLYSGKAKLGLSKESVNELGKVFANAFAQENYQMVPKIIPTMNGKERKNFSEIYGEAVEFASAEARIAWTNTMNNYAMGFSAEAPTTGITPPPPTP